MGLKDIKLKPVYYSDEDNLLQEFYIPVLSNSIKYDRIAGYFSSNSLAIAAKGIGIFINAGGRIRLIANVVLSEEDQKAIKEALLNKEKELLIEIEKLEDQLKKDHIRMLGWMVKNGLLDIKIAVVKNGVEHQKIGILTDSDGNIISFSGSDNETVKGWLYNDEQFHVFCRWKEGDRSHLLPDINRFNCLWHDKGIRVRVYNVSDAFTKGLIRNAPTNDIEFKKLSSSITKELLQLNSIRFSHQKKPKKIKLRDYQKSAIDKWVANRFKGIFEMATGTGKTYTSLFAVRSYLKKNRGRYALIICCPFQHLVDQWEANVRRVFADCVIVKCYIGKAKWYEQLNVLFQNLVFGAESFGIVITTTVTGSAESFINTVNTDKVAKIVVCDEVHNIGSEGNKQFLKIDSNARIGLSATPIRRYDEEGNKAIREYFGESVYKLPIKDAIDMGFLVPYNYFVRICELSEEEYEEYKKISGRIAQLYSNGVCSDEDHLGYWLRQRTRILSKCRSKLAAFREVLDSIESRYNMLVFTAEDQSFFESTLEVLTNHNITTLQITSAVVPDPNERISIIRKLEKRDIDCILAMRCLDEGIDIPSVDKAIILASSTNSKQYIQRRGRVLRKFEDWKTHADIYDFFVVPPEFHSELDKGLYERELGRILEFASTASNYDAVREILSFSRRNTLMKTFARTLMEFNL